MGFFTTKKSEEPLPADMLVADHSAGLLTEVWSWTKSILIALLIVALVHQYGFHLSTVKGASMQPTLEENELLFINKTVHFLGSPSRGDVVVVKEPESSEPQSIFLVKRVVAVAGDEVRIQQGKLYVNGLFATESYTDSLIEDGSLEPYTIPQGSLFVMGDNRHRLASYDSRSFGAVSVDKIEGRAEFIVWPLSKLRML
ncbi:signal peptidase I [Paenibacillus sp. 1_12]|uniref:signal peptidase I n=1 Tax=Paenibacillus sp. 1_12 TaxID=1566278 RepID=UPI0008E35504|nr:signal peptidase I [Paenibacillus sp. 1_12]SFM03593.1 signal peptidase I [Paenibacillus sp. 1_12]